MFQLVGRVVALNRRQDQYAILELRRSQAGLLGSTMKVLVPPLVLARDGEPDAGAYVEIGAQSLAAAGVSRQEWDCLLVARYIAESDGSPAEREPQEGTSTPSNRQNRSTG